MIDCQQLLVPLQVNKQHKKKWQTQQQEYLFIGLPLNPI